MSPGPAAKNKNEWQDFAAAARRVPHGSLAGGLAGWLSCVEPASTATTSHPCGLNRKPACLSGNSCCASGLQHLETSLVCFGKQRCFWPDAPRRGISHPRRHQLAGRLLGSEHLGSQARGPQHQAQI